MAYNMDLEDRIEELGEPVKRICVKRMCVKSTSGPLLTQLRIHPFTHIRNLYLTQQAK